jgi:TrmH family RNA methyltransferase
MPAFISAPDNPLIKRLVQLHDAPARREQCAFLAEGLRLIDGFIQAGWQPLELFIREGLEKPGHWPEATTISARVAQRLSSATTASGYVALFALPTPPPIIVADGGLILTGVADPGNVGTLIRSAAAFGIRQVVLDGGADPFGPKAVAATAGALALVAIHRGGPELVAGGAPACALVVSGGVAPSALPPGRRWLVVGGEANGIPSVWLQACCEFLTLPMPGGTESLNAAVAGSIAAYVLSVGLLPGARDIA